MEKDIFMFETKSPFPLILVAPVVDLVFYEDLWMWHRKMSFVFRCSFFIQYLLLDVFKEISSLSRTST